MKIRKSRGISIISFTLFIVVVLAISIFLSNSLIQISNYTIESNKIPLAFDGFKIVQISDLHSKVFWKDNNPIIKKIKAQNPDIVVMTGDMVNTSDENFDIFLKLAETISSDFLTFYVVGNHEQYLFDEKKIPLINSLQEIGVNVLDNEAVSITINGSSINLYGLWFNLRYYKDLSNVYTKDIYFNTENMHTILDESDKSKFNILLTHNPLYFDTYSIWGADLTLAGHIHGGMIRLPFLGGLLSPEREFFPKYSAGEYFLDESILIVNRGLGRGEFGSRVFNFPDISVITLYKK